MSNKFFNKSVALSVATLVFGFSFAPLAAAESTDIDAPKEESTSMLNKDVLAGRWQELKGHVKEQWGKLTDDDIMQIDGKKDVLLGKLRTQYGYSKEEADKQLAEFEKAHSSK